MSSLIARMAPQPDLQISEHHYTWMTGSGLGEAGRASDTRVKEIGEGSDRLMLKVRKGSAQNPVTRKEAAAKIKPMGGLGGNNIK